jgi:hypothetical protein
MPVSRQAGEDLQGMLVPRQADPHASPDAANDPALMALHCVWVERYGAISPCRQRVPVSLRCHRQVYQVAGNNPSGQNQQAIRSEIYQVHHMQI